MQQESNNTVYTATENADHGALGEFLSTELSCLIKEQAAKDVAEMVDELYRRTARLRDLNTELRIEIARRQIEMPVADESDADPQPADTSEETSSYANYREDPPREYPPSLYL